MDILNQKNLIIIILGLIILALLIILLIKFRPKKVKPIDFTIDDEEKSDIEKVIEEMEQTNESRKMTTFEEEQEANAIISYQELVKAVGDKKTDKAKEEMTEAQLNLVDEIAKIKENKNKKNLEETLEDEIEETLVEDNLESEEEKEIPKFKNSEFISPVFGKDNNNDNFLKELKDFREKL